MILGKATIPEKVLIFFIDNTVKARNTRQAIYIFTFLFYCSSIKNKKVYVSYVKIVVSKKHSF